MAAGLCPDPLRELKRSPDFIFKSQMQQKRLAAGLRPDPLGELQRSPRPPSRSGCHGREHSLAAVRDALRRGRGRVEVRGRSRCEREGLGLLLNLSSREISSSSQNACLAAGLCPNPLRELKRSPHFIFKSQMQQKRLAAGLRPDPLGELERSPRPPSRSGCHGREHSLAAVGGALRRGRG